eukprot:evm.model.scf_1180.1 EVM.evm.TU.scf_1180.1   scf_1180:6438-12340(-)
MALWLGALILACALAAEGGGKRSSPSGAGLRISRSCDELLEAMTTTGGPADVTVLVEGTVDCSGPPPPAVNAVVNNKTLTIKPAAAGAPAMIDFGGMEGAIQLAGGARIVLRNLVLVQDAMGPDPIELRAFSASGANGGSGGRIHVDGCSILARACQAPPEADEQKVAAWNDAPAAAPPHRLPRGALAGSADRLSLGGPKIGAETVDQFGGKPLHLIVCDTAVACDVGDSPSPSLAPARHSDSRYVRHSDCQSPAKPEIKTARVPIAPSAVLVSAVSAMLFLGAGIRSRGRWMRRWAKSFGGFGCVSCRRCKYDGADGGMGGLDRNLEPLCMEVPYVNDPTMSVGSLEGMELSELFGMLLWEMVSGSRAFSGKHRNDIMVTVVDGRRPSIPSHCPTKFASLIRACWQQDNTRRPTFKKIVGQLQRLASTYSSPLTHNLIGMAIREEQQSVETWQGETREGRSSMDGGKARVVKAHEVQSQDPASPDRPLVASPPASSGSICSPPKNNPLWTGLPRKTEVLGNPLWGARSSPCSNPPQDPSHFSFWHMGSTPSQGKHPDPGSPGDSREEAGAHVIPMKRLPLKLPQRISADCPEPLLTSRSDSASELTSSSFRRDDPTEDATGGLIDLCPSSSASSVTVPVASSYGPGAAMPWRSVTPNYQHNVRLGNFRPRGNLDNMGLIKPRATAEAKPAVDAAKVAAVANPELSLWLTTSQGSGLGSFTALDPKAQAPLSPLSPQHPPMPSSPVPPATPPPLPNGARRSGGACAGPATHIPLLAISKITGGASEAVIKSPGYGPQGWEMQYTNGAEAVKADRHPRRPSWCTSLFDTSGSCSFRSAISATTEAGNASPGSLPWTPAASGTATPGTAKASAVGMDRFNYRLFTTDPGLGSARRDELEPGFEPLITQSDFGEIVPVAVVEGPAAKAPGPDAGGSRIPNVGNMGVASGTQSMLASGANSAMASGMTSGLASGGATGMSAMWETSDAAGELTTTQTSMLSELGPFNEVLQQWDTI